MTPCQCLQGVVGLAKAGLQVAGVPVDQADDAIVAARLDACRGCDAATRNPARLDRPTKGLTTLSRCGDCGCVLAAKVRIASETCPRAKW